METSKNLNCVRLEKLTVMKDLPTCRAGAVVYCNWSDAFGSRLTPLRKRREEDAKLLTPYLEDGVTPDDAFSEIMRAYKKSDFIKAELAPEKIQHLSCPKCGSLDAIMEYDFSSGYVDGVTYRYIHPILVCAECGNKREIDKYMYRSYLK